MFDLLVDIYAVDETTVNRTPTESETPFEYALPARWVNVSARERYAALGAGVKLTGRLRVRWVEGLKTNFVVKDVRTREGHTVETEHDIANYRITAIRADRRQTVAELDLEGLNA